MFKNVENNKSCSFFGHRNVILSDVQKSKLQSIIEHLIVDENICIFLFGSNSSFNNICYEIVTKLKEKYPYLKRIAYTCKSEGCILESDRDRWDKICTKYIKNENDLFFVEEEYEFKNKYISGKAGYIERNKEMVDNSEFTIIYYNKNYLPKLRKRSKGDICYYQPQSGTKVIYDYLVSKEKRFLNVAKSL